MNGLSAWTAARPVAQRVTLAGDATGRAGSMTTGVWRYDTIARPMAGTPKAIGRVGDRSGDENVWKRS